MPNYNELKKAKDLLQEVFEKAVERNAPLDELKPVAEAMSLLFDKVAESADNGEMSDDDSCILMADCTYIIDKYKDLAWDAQAHKTHTVRMETSPLCRL